MTILLGSGEIMPGSIVCWKSVIGDQRGRVTHMRSGLMARVEVFVPYRDNGRRMFQASGQVVDLPLSSLRTMIAGRSSGHASEASVVELQAKSAVVSELMLYGDIGGFAGDITADRVAAALKPLDKKSRLNVYLSSPGGSPLEAFTIASQFNRWEGTVVVYIDGIAASAATILALAGNHVYMSSEAIFMIHRAWTAAIGDREELLHTMEVLDTIDNMMADIYHRKTGINRDRILDMMTEETWMNSEAAKKQGFSDGTVEPSKRNAKGTSAMMDRPWFSRLPNGNRRPGPVDRELEPAVAGSQSVGPASVCNQDQAPPAQEQPAMGGVS